MGGELGQIAEQPARAILNQPVWLETIINHLPPQPSENWERNAVAALLWLIVNKKAPPAPWGQFKTVADIAAWFPRQNFCGSEDFSRIYGAHNLCSAIASREAFRLLGNKEGFDFLTKWVRAHAGYMVFGAGRTRGRDPLDSQFTNQGINKPMYCIHAGAPNSRVNGAPFLTWAGDRSWVLSHPGFIGNVPMTALLWLVHGEMEKYLKAELHSPIIEALVATHHDVNPYLITTEETQIAKAAINNDVNSLLKIWNEWIAPMPLPNDKFLIIRRKTGEEWVRLSGSKAPTAQLDYQSHMDNGEVRSMAANDGYRTGQDTDGNGTLVDPTEIVLAEDNPSTVDVDERFLYFTAQCTVPPYQKISVKGLDGEIVFACIIGDGVRELLVPKIVPPLPDDVPVPGGVPRRPSTFRRLYKKLLEAIRKIFNF